MTAIRTSCLRSLPALLLVAAGWAAAAQQTLPTGRPDSLKLAVIGDNGTGERPQYELAERMAAARQKFPYELVLMVGDNLYGRQKPKDFVDKFEKPYAPLLDAGVKFFAALGNHDEPDNRLYPAFNMGGERYYTFARKNIRFFVLDTNFLDPKQIAWFENALRESQDEWKICYFHHPLYSDSRRHGSDVELRTVLEPILVRYNVNVVFAGHDHIYERIRPQKGIVHFVCGAGGQLRKGDVEESDTTAAAFDQDVSFMLVEIAGSDLFFEVLSRTGQTVDKGTIQRRPTT